MTLDFLHTGAAKAASTWLYQACLEHPEVYVPPNNDNVNFFLVHYHRGLDWFRTEYFADRKSEEVGGEFSNSYMLSDVALRRIELDLPDVRLSCLLRNPIERAYLHWAHAYYKSGRPQAHPETDSGSPLDIMPDPAYGEAVSDPAGGGAASEWVGVVPGVAGAGPVRVPFETNPRAFSRRASVCDAVRRYSSRSRRFPVRVLRILGSGQFVSSSLSVPGHQSRYAGRRTPVRCRRSCVIIFVHFFGRISGN